MKKVITIGITLILFASVLAGIATAKENQKWGFKLNINLQDQLQPYLKVLTDMIVSEINKMNSTYRINSYDSSLNGVFRMADAMMSTENGVEYSSGEYTNANLSFYADGVFPYANNVSQAINGSFEPKNMNISATLNVLNKHLSNGTVEESSPGNISQIISTSSSYMKIHFKGKNIPLPVLFYYLLEFKAVKYQHLGIKMNLSYVKSMSNLTNICLRAQVNETINGNPINSTIKISDVYINSNLATLNVIDKNHDGYFDTGDYLCIHLDTSNIGQLVNGLSITFNLSYLGHMQHFSLWLNPDDWSTNFGGEFVLPIILPQYSNLMNETKNLPMYDNFDFTIIAKLYSHTITNYTPSLPLIPRNKENITMVTTGNYSGTIQITGLQEKYMRILEEVLNITFPLNLQSCNIPVLGLSNGTIHKSSTMCIEPVNITGTMQYGNENVYVVHFNILKTHKFIKFDLWYFYSPTKKFIVGGGVKIGVKRFDTQATTYTNAKEEINSIKNVKSGGGGTNLPTKNSSLLLVSIGIAVFVIIVGIAIALWRRKKTS